MKTIGFIGLGNMGRSMASNLLKAGNKVQIFDLDENVMKSLEREGASIRKNPKECANNSDAVVTMLPNNKIVSNAYLNPETGIIHGNLKPDAILIDSSTTSPSIAQEISKQVSSVPNKRVGFVDGPVSGGVNGAKLATLTFMVGGSEVNFKRAQPVLQHMGKNLIHCGDVGTGQTAKICNNMLLAISMIGVSEAMNLGIKLGMDKAKLASVINTSTGRCWSSDTYNPVGGVFPNVPSSNNYEGGFASALMLKDLGLALEAANSVGAATALGSASQSFYQLMCANGLEKNDFSVAYKFLKGNK